MTIRNGSEKFYGICGLGQYKNMGHNITTKKSKTKSLDAALNVTSRVTLKCRNVIKRDVKMSMKVTSRRR